MIKTQLYSIFSGIKWRKSAHSIVNVWHFSLIKEWLFELSKNLFWFHINQQIKYSTTHYSTRISRNCCENDRGITLVPSFMRGCSLYFSVYFILTPKHFQLYHSRHVSWKKKGQCIWNFSPYSNTLTWLIQTTVCWFGQEFFHLSRFIWVRIKADCWVNTVMKHWERGRWARGYVDRKMGCKKEERRDGNYSNKMAEELCLMPS